jgi:hypothetical protein
MYICDTIISQPTKLPAEILQHWLTGWLYILLEAYNLNTMLFSS